LGEKSKLNLEDEDFDEELVREMLPGAPRNLLGGVPPIVGLVAI
jgi:hypothetical protein